VLADPPPQRIVDLGERDSPTCDETPPRAERPPCDAAAGHREQRIAPLDERARQLSRQAQLVVELPQQQHPRVVADLAVLEGDGDLLRAEKSEGGSG
jgi:hypothetical protein